MSPSDVARVVETVRKTLASRGRHRDATRRVLRLQEMAAGSTAYLTVDLEPGRYAWVSEVPDPLGKGMLQPFVVAPED